MRRLPSVFAERVKSLPWLRRHRASRRGRLSIGPIGGFRTVSLEVQPGPEVLGPPAQVEALAGDVEFAADAFHLRGDPDFALLLKLFVWDRPGDSLGYGFIVHDALEGFREAGEVGAWLHRGRWFITFRFCFFPCFLIFEESILLCGDGPGSLNARVLPQG